MSETASNFYSMRREYLTYLIRQSLHEAAKSAHVYDQKLADSLFSHLVVMTHNCDWYISQAEGETSHDLVIDIATPRREGFSYDEIALLLWSICAILKTRNWFEIPKDETDAFLKNNPGASGLLTYENDWADHFNDPTPFAGNSVEAKSFRELEDWHMWTNLTIRLTYSGAFNAALGANEKHYLKLFETALDFERVDPSRFDPEAYIERLESNFENLTDTA